jgi:superfamily I DNA/RNA helicase
MAWIDFQKSLNQRQERINLDQEQKTVEKMPLEAQCMARGVAGSGKSLLLRTRVQKLREKGFTDILVLCYNRFMKGWLIREVGSSSTFHSWAYSTLKYNYQWDDDPETRRQVIDLARKFGRRQKRFNAILVDEAQDFYDEWFQSLLEIINPNTNSFFFVYDNTQSVYGKGHRAKRNFKWRDLGLDIQGKNSQVLDLNYRNSPEILEIAWQYIKPALDKANLEVGRRTYDQRGRVKNTPEIWEIVEPLKNPSRSSRIQPMLVDVSSREVPSTVAEEVNLALDSCPESSIGILTHPNNKDIRQEIHQELTELGIEHHAPTHSRERDTNVVHRPCVLVDSWNAVKGVEFDAVIIVGADWVTDYADIDEDFEEKAGLYVAMTRARDHLVILYEERTDTVEWIEEILDSEPVLRSA